MLAPYLFFHRLIVPGADTINYYYPAMHWFAEALKEGDSFLWNPTLLSGFPSYLSQVSGYFDPVNVVLFSLIPSAITAYHLRLVFDFVLVSLFSYLIARKWGISKLAAFFIGPTYLLAFHWWYLSNTLIANTLFLLPFLLWAYESGEQANTWTRRIAFGSLGGLGVGWAFLSGYAQVVIYALVLVGLYAVYGLIFFQRDRINLVPRAISTSTLLGLFAVIGFIAGAPQILASLAHTPFSVRSGGLSYAVTQGKVLKLGEMIFFLVPDYLRLPLFNGGRKPLYIGAMSFFMAMGALSRINRAQPIGAVMMIFLFSLVTALPYSPIFFILHQLPMFDLFRYPYRWMYLGVWALAVLAAFGFDRLRRAETSRADRFIASTASLIALILWAGIAGATVLGEWFWEPVKRLGFELFRILAYAEGVFPKGLDHYEAAVGRAVDAWRELLAIGNEYVLIPAAILLFSAIILQLRSRDILRGWSFDIAVSSVLVATCIGIFAVRWQDSLPANVIYGARDAYADKVNFDDFVEYRMAQFDPGGAFVPRHSNIIWNTQDTNVAVDLAHALAVPNVNQFTGVSLIDGYEPFITRDLLSVTAKSLASNYTSQDELIGVTFEQRRRMFENRMDLMAMMGGKYVVSGTPLESEQLEFLGHVRATEYDTHAYLYHNPEARPRVAVAANVIAWPHQSLSELLDAGARFDSGETYLDCGICPPSSSDAVLEVKTANGYFAIGTESEAAFWLIVSETYLPGWQAELDGEPVEPVRANGMYMAFKIPPGEHRLELQYEGILGEARWLYPLGLFPRAPLSW